MCLDIKILEVLNFYIDLLDTDQKSYNFSIHRSFTTSTHKYCLYIKGIIVQIDNFSFTTFFVNLCSMKKRNRLWSGDKILKKEGITSGVTIPSVIFSPRSLAV